jgi:hypothetical protein
MQVGNTSKGQVLAVPTKDVEGRSILAVILKYTFGFSGLQPRLAENPAPVDLVDTYHGDDPANASIRRPSQLFHYKPGTDVILLGHAHPPPGRSATHVDVLLHVGPIRKIVRAHGFRTFMPGAFGGLKPGPAVALHRPVPLIYELAWGGTDASDPERPIGEPRNYVGRGVARSPKELVDRPAPQLEYGDRPFNVPAAFNPIHRHWQPRVRYAGTYDDEWTDARMPLLPRDFDDRYHVCVPEDQWSETPLRSDVLVEIANATPDGVWRFQLPRIVPGFSSVVLGRRSEHRTHLDTILIDADLRTVELTFRAAIVLPLKFEMVDRILVFEKAVV